MRAIRALWTIPLRDLPELNHLRAGIPSAPSRSVTATKVLPMVMELGTKGASRNTQTRPNSTSKPAARIRPLHLKDITTTDIRFRQVTRAKMGRVGKKKKAAKC